MVQTLPPVPTTALLTLFQNSYACSIALAISSTSLPASAGQVIPCLILSSLVVQTKVETDSGTGLAVLRACGYSGTSGTSGVDGSGDGSGGDGGDDRVGDHDGGCDDDGSSGGGGGGDDGCFGDNSSSLQAYQSSDDCFSGRWGNRGSCCLCNNCISPAPSPPAPCRYTCFGLCSALLGSRSCCWGEMFLLSFPLSLRDREIER